MKVTLTTENQTNAIISSIATRITQINENEAALF